MILHRTEPAGAETRLYAPLAKGIGLRLTWIRVGWEGVGSCVVAVVVVVVVVIVVDMLEER